ncbi:hypothetical protein ACWEO1_03265 [Kitasatospora cineracea]
MNAATSVVAAVLLPPFLPLPPPSSPSRTEWWAGWTGLFRDRVLRTLMAAQAAFAFGRLIPTVVLPVYLVEVAGLPAWLPSTAPTVNAVAVVLTQSLATARVVAFPRARVMSWAATLTSARSPSSPSAPPATAPPPSSPSTPRSRSSPPARSCPAPPPPDPRNTNGPGRIVRGRSRVKHLQAVR